MAIEYLSSLDEITPEMLDGGFWAGWPNPPDSSTHLQLLRNSQHAIVAVDRRAGQVVGFITAVSDGVLCAYIPLLEVLEEYQVQGIGGQLVTRMLEELRGLYMIDLLCDEELQPYYERFGMQRATGMLMRNYDRQSGR